MTRVRFAVLLVLALVFAVPATASADFGFLGEFGSSGQGNGQFLGYPTYLDVAPDGAVWIAEDGARVQKFSPDGQYLTQVQVGRFRVGPVATDGAGNLYVGNRDDYVVQKFDPSGSPLATIGTGNGSGPGQFQDICGMDVDAAGNVYVSDGRVGYCDTAPRIQKFDAGGTLVKEIKLTGKSDPDGVGDIAVAGDGSIYVADPTHFGKSEIFKLSPDGALIGRFGSRGSGPAQFAEGGPYSIALAPDGTLYVSDQGNQRIQHLSADGGFLNQFGAATSFHGVGVGPNGDVWVARGRQSVPTQEDTDGLGINRVMHFGPDAPPAPPSPLALSPSVKISVGALVQAKNCGLRDPETGKPIKNCAGIRKATIDWSAGCPAPGPLTRRTVEIQIPRYEAIVPR